MAFLYVAEFSEVGRRLDGLEQIAKMPPLAEQRVAIGGASAASAAFNASTSIIRVHTDAICSISIGAAPTATTSMIRLAADQTEYFAVPKGKSYKIANISNT